MRIQHIIPAIIPDSLIDLERNLRDVRGVAHRVQIDVMDGTYTTAKSWPYEGANREAFEAIRREDEGLPYWQDFDFEIDLLLKNPEERVEEWQLAGAACLIAHVESTEKLSEFVGACVDKRIEVGLAIKPSSDIELFAPFVETAQFVQVMGNDLVGKQGVPLDEKALDMIRAIKKRWPTLVVGVDIGVHEDTIPQLLDAGATRFAAGSAVYGMGDAARSYQKLERLVSEYLHT